MKNETAIKSDKKKKISFEMQLKYMHVILFVPKICKLFRHI